MATRGDWVKAARTARSSDWFPGFGTWKQGPVPNSSEQPHPLGQLGVLSTDSAANRAYCRGRNPQQGAST